MNISKLFFSFLSLQIFCFFIPSASTAEKSKQPISFNHKIHLSKQIECLFCHEEAEEKVTAGRPGIDICESCHFKVQKGSDEEKKLQKFIKNKENLN